MTALTPEALIAFNLALLAAWIAPGPAMLVAVQETVRGGWRGGAAAGLGLAMIAPLWTLAALLGLDTVFAVVPWAYTGLRIVGAVYLIWIAWQTWNHALAPLPNAPDVAARAMRRGMLVNLGNPKSILFAAAVLVVIFPRDLSFADAVIVSLNHFVLEVALYVALATVLSRPAMVATYRRAKSFFDRISALVLGGLGLRILFDRAQG